MSTTRIEKLLKNLPPDAPYLGRFSRYFHAPGIPVEVDIWAEACNDPAFGSKFIDSFLKLGRPLPDSITEAELRRVYAYASGQSDDRDAREALALEHHCNTQRRTLLRCLLLREELDFAQVAQRAGLSEHTVRMYEALYWNVRGRDKIYVTSLVYPQGRQVEWAPDYGLNENPMNLALRAAWNEGIEAAEELLGLKNPVHESGASGHARSLANRILSNGNFMAKLGFLNQDLPAMKHALRLLLAFKQGHGPLAVNASERQVGQMSAAMAVAVSINRIVPDFEGSSGMQLGKQPALTGANHLQHAA